MKNMMSKITGVEIIEDGSFKTLRVTVDYDAKTAPKLLKTLGTLVNLTILKPKKDKK